MTGPDHYREAERLTEAITKRDALSGARILQPGDHRDALALAQVHATLALAAATALPHAGELPVADHDEWWAAAGVDPVWRDRGRLRGEAVS